MESLDLITASILSKKLAAGLEGLVLDVKCGSGAFMKSQDEAKALARALVDTANAAGCPTSALITDMSQPLAPSLGNALEVVDVMRVLSGDMKGRLLDLTIELGGALLAQAKIEDGARKISDAISGGAAAEKFGAMVYATGGPVRFVENWARFLPEAPVIREITAPASGIVSTIDGEALGLAVVALGGGRQVETDLVDPAVGLSEVVTLGETVTKGQPLARVHAAREGQADAAALAVQTAITIGGTPAETPLVLDRIA